MDELNLKLATIVSAPFGENTYVAHLDGRRNCLVVDPGLEPDRILEYLAQAELTPAAILNTHGHGDHIGGNAAMKEAWPDCPIVIGRREAPMLTDARLNLSEGFGLSVVSPPADVLLDEGELYQAAGFTLETREIPGHSPGHVVFVWGEGRPMHVFGGDVLFAGGVGRSDFPGGSFSLLSRGIHGKLFTLPDETVILPGHGEPTTIGREKKTNPYVGAPSGFRPVR